MSFRLHRRRNSRLTYSLVGHWKLNENTGLIAYDSSGNNNHGNILGGAVRTTEEINNGLFFDGIDDKISTDADVGGLDSKTFAGRYKWTSLGSGWQLMTMESDAIFDNANFVGLTTSGSAEKYIFCYQSYASGTSSFLVGTDFAPSLNTWYFVAGVINKSDNSLRLYINGTQYNIYKNASVGSATFYNPSGGVAIGGKTNAAYFFNGFINNVCVYNRALSADEINELYLLTK